MHRIVIVSNHKGFFESLVGRLGPDQFLPEYCLHEDLVKLASPETIDILIFDIGSNDHDPGEVKRLIQAAEDRLPIIIGLVDLEAVDSVQSIEILDDFIVTGASMAEIEARIHKLLRSSNQISGDDVIRCGELLIDLPNYTVYISNRLIRLTYKEYELLRFLATNPDRVFDRRTLLSKVWGYDFYGGDRTVDVHIRRLRSKIEDRQYSFIETVRNVGYRFHSA